MRLTGAQIVCECLVREGVDVIFGIPGGAILPFYDALYHYPGIRHVLVRHEQAAAHAAEGYARAAGKVGVCVATSGPGATNLITGLAAAKMDSVPMVAITGQVARPFMGKEAFQECDTTGLAKSVTKRSYLVLRASDLAPTMREAMEVAMSGRPGPVLVDVPKDVQAEVAEFQYPDAPVRPSTGGLRSNDQVLREAARLLAEAERPVIIAGHGVLISGAWEELRQVAERANVPVVNTLLGLGGFPRSHPLSLGMLGMHGMYWSNIAVAEADLVLGVGMRFDDRVIGKPGTFAPKAKVIHIEVEPSQVNKNVFAHLPLVGDARQVLRALLPLLERRERSAWLARLRLLQERHPSLFVPDGPGLPPQYVLARLDQMLHGLPDWVAVTGVGQHQMWAAQYLSVERPNSFISSGGLGVMGYELPAALGAQMGRPGTTVWTIAGDGGFQMTLQELATLAQENLPVKIAVFHNGCLGMVRQWQELFYERRYKAIPVSSPDYVKLAEAYGFPGLQVTTREGVEPALERAMKYPGPFLIDFVVNTEENVYPMVPPGASLAETIEDPRSLAGVSVGAPAL
ncbi:MAG: biosynthetic-type acetolactate synthase large subunit [Chloroflexi bacterium]|nr:biosynthetic-type acetolactate synthase large subunit [Chloroflexota bacterium]